MLNGRAPASGVRPALAVIVFLAVLSPACSSGESPQKPSRQTADDDSPARVANRWEPVAEFSGDGDEQTRSFVISPDALQWRVTAGCTGGSLEVGLPGVSEPLARPGCPGSEFGFSIETGSRSLVVAADGPWTVVVDQQLNTPLSEPKLQGMTDRAVLAEGSFYGIDQSGEGVVRLYELPGGRRALRFEPFRVTSNSDLFVWVSRNRKPGTSEEAYASEHVVVGRLKATSGAQNYLLPDELPAEAFGSVVIWCEPIRVAYAAATLAAR